MSIVRPTHLAFTALALGLMLPLLSLSPFALGYWDKAEPLVVAIHAVAALASFALVWEDLVHPGRLWYRLRQPVAAVPLLIGAVSVVLAPAMEMPLLSLWGPPQSGQGALWFLDLAVLVAAAGMVREHPGLWRKLVLLAIGTTLVIAALKGWDWWADYAGTPHLLIWVAAYYGWLALPLAVLVIELCPLRRTVLGVGLLAVVATLVTSRNITAGAATLMAGSGTALCWWWRRWEGPSRRLACTAVLAVAGLPPLVLASFDAVRSVRSLDDRRSLLAMLWQSETESSPLTWLIGHGWGRVQDAYQANLAFSGEHLWDDSWTFMQSDYFHAHNAVVESTHALGVVGLLLTLLLSVAPIIGAPKDRLPLAAGLAVGTAFLGSLWFPLVLSMPILAAAQSVVARPLPPQPPRQGNDRIVIGAIVIMALAQLVSAAMLLQHGLRLAEFNQRVERYDDRLPIVAGDDLPVAEIIRDSFYKMESLHDADAQARALPMAERLIAILSARMPTTHTAQISITGLSLMGQVYLSKTLPWLADSAGGLSRWHDWLEMALTLMPDRSDLAIPYLTAQAGRGNNEEVHRWAARFLERRSDDPVGHYFLGLVTIQQAGRREAGFALLNRSLDEGMDRFMPIDPAFRRLVTEGVRP
jgi:hypothetical protein